MIKFQPLETDEITLDRNVAFRLEIEYRDVITVQRDISFDFHNVLPTRVAAYPPVCLAEKVIICDGINFAK